MFADMESCLTLCFFFPLSRQKNVESSMSQKSQRMAKKFGKISKFLTFQNLYILVPFCRAAKSWQLRDPRENKVTLMDQMQKEMSTQSW